MKKIDLLGQSFGRLVVIGYSDPIKRKTFWTCRCVCGIEKSINADALTSGRTKSCGCIRLEMAPALNASLGMRRKKPLLGARFFRLTIIGESGREKHGNILWRCLCDCGAYTSVTSASLVSGNTKSCGCLKVARMKDVVEARSRNYRAVRGLNPDIPMTPSRLILRAKFNELSYKIKKRDNFTCQLCLVVGGKLASHHIRPWAKFPELRFDEFNLITLCSVPCHKFKAHSGNFNNLPDPETTKKLNEIMKNKPSLESIP